MKPDRAPFSAHFANFGRGVLMGGADIIPGVSGGTVALILGIYERLVTAISHVDLRLVGHLRARKWFAAANHLDAAFLLALGCGILAGVAALAHLMKHMLTEHPMETYAFFFGLILASGLLVGRMIQVYSPLAILLFVGGMAAAYAIVGLVPTVASHSHGYLFLCGAIAICAMILPGISGAYILVILGNYSRILDALRALSHGQVTGELLATVAVFASGCVLGLLSFAKLLRWLLARHESITMAALCGFIFGSLRKVWPFKIDHSPHIEDLNLKELTNRMPETLSEALLPLALAIFAAALVFSLEYVSNARRSPALKSPLKSP